MAYEQIEFEVGEILGADKLNTLANNLDLLRKKFYGTLGPAESTITRGIIYADTSSSTWTIRLNDGNDWIDLFYIDTAANVVVYPGDYITSEGIQDGSITTDKVKNGELNERTIAPLALKETHVSSGIITRDKIAEGGIDSAALTANCIQKYDVASGAAQGNHFRIREYGRKVTGPSTEHEFREFCFLPDIRNRSTALGSGIGNAYLYGINGQCYFESSSAGKTAFRIKGDYLQMDIRYLLQKS